MTFEDAIASLGAEFGADLAPEEGVAAFSAAVSEGDEPVEVVIRERDGRACADLSADLGELPAAGGEALLWEMLEANHFFGGTGGAALSVDGTRAKLERRASFDELGRGEGARVLLPFLAMAGRWRAAVARAARGAGGMPADNL